MPKETLTLENLKIASPCAIRWEQMHGDERTRFCSMCELQVYNVSDMTRAEAQKFLIENSDKPNCMRFFRRKDGTILTKDCPVGERLALRFKRKTQAAAALLMCFLNALPTFAQDLTPESKGTSATTSTAETSQETVKPAKTYSVFQAHPTVIDERGVPTGRGERVQKTSPLLPEGAPKVDCEVSKPLDGEKKHGTTAKEAAEQTEDSRTLDDSSKPAHGPRDSQVFNANPAALAPASSTSGREYRRRTQQKPRVENPEKR